MRGWDAILWLNERSCAAVKAAQRLEKRSAVHEGASARGRAVYGSMPHISTGETARSGHKIPYAGGKTSAIYPHTYAIGVGVCINIRYGV